MTEITDAMVVRVSRWITEDPTRRDLDMTNDEIRSMLDAALNELEIAVSDAMRCAGESAYVEYCRQYRDAEVGVPVSPLVQHVYRAMRALEPKVEMVCPTCSGEGRPRTAAESLHDWSAPYPGGRRPDFVKPTRSVDAYGRYVHRRKGDVA